MPRIVLDSIVDSVCNIIFPRDSVVSWDQSWRLFGVLYLPMQVMTHICRLHTIWGVLRFRRRHGNVTLHALPNVNKRCTHTGVLKKYGDKRFNEKAGWVHDSASNYPIQLSWYSRYLTGNENRHDFVIEVD